MGRFPAPPVAEPSSPGTRHGRRRPAIMVVAVLLALAVATVGWFTLRPDPGTSARGPSGGGTPAGTSANPVPGSTAGAGGPGGAAPSAAAGGAAGPGASGAAPGASGAAAPGASAAPVTTGGTNGTTATAQRPSLPPGWREYRDRTGFSLYVPAGWRQSRKGTIVYFRPPGGGRVLGIDQTDRPKSDPVADWRGQADYRVGRGDFPGYDEIRIASVRYWQKAADWEFTFDGGNRRHVNNRGFVVSRSQAYGIWWETSDADWDAARSDLQLIFDSFRPAAS